MRVFFGIIPLLILVACAPRGQIKVINSVVDGSTHISMDLINVSNDNRLLMGLYARDTVLVLEVGTYGIVDIPSGESFKGMVDGERFSFDALGDSTKHKRNWSGLLVSTRKYKASRDFLNSIGSGRAVWLRLDIDDEFIEEKIDPNSPYTPRTKLREFYDTWMRLHF